MSMVLNMVGAGGMSTSKPLIHVTAVLGATVSFEFGGIVVREIGPDEAIANVDGVTAEYYYSAPATGLWTVVAVDGNNNSVSSTVTVSSNEEYDLMLARYIGSLYNAGVYDSSISHQFVVYNGAVVTDQASYINVKIAGGAQREGGVRFGPLLLGSSYTFSCRNANSNNILFAGGASTTPVSRVGSMTITSGMKNIAANSSTTFTVDTSSKYGETGYIYAWAYFDYAWNNARNDSRIISVVAS